MGFLNEIFDERVAYMRLETALRWQRLWWFISLDSVQTFSQDLWLHLLLKDLREKLQSRINPEEDLPTFGSDPRPKAYRALEWFRHFYGDDNFEYLRSWQRSVFIQGGDDRVEEFVWDTLAYDLFHRATELNLREEFRFALQQFHEIREERLTDFKKRLSEASQLSLSVWDQKIITAEGASLDIVLSTITNIGTSNIFVLSWRDACTSKGLSFLEGIFDAALRVALEDTSGRLIFSADTLPFPSSWEVDLEKSLNGIVVVPSH
jgi:hypothetical protein